MLHYNHLYLLQHGHRGNYRNRSSYFYFILAINEFFRRQEGKIFHSLFIAQKKNILLSFSDINSINKFSGYKEKRNLVNLFRASVSSVPIHI